MSVPVLLTALLATGCGGGKPAPSNLAVKPTFPAPLTACSLLSEQQVASAFGAAGVKAEEQQVTDLGEKKVHGCAYRRGSFVVVVTLITGVEAEPEDAVRDNARDPQASPVNGVGGYALGYRSALGQEIVVSGVRRAEETRVTTISGPGGSQDKLAALLRDILTKL
ncbi:hypothetical protein [Longimycelium tulufanense]|nr:hypothetical protein [Longimycelium tulufanense]